MESESNVAANVERTNLPVKSLVLDPDNPRFSHLKALEGKKTPTDEEMMNEIGSDSEIITLMKAIKRAGVRDPIWVKAIPNGKYLVIEGNRRTYILRKLLEEHVEPPPGVRYDTVPANIYPPETTESELLLQRVALQAGKKPWGPFNEAKATYELRYVHGLEIEDIATELQKSQTKVKEDIQNVELLIEYVKATGDADAQHFAYFANAPKRVKEWISNTANKKLYFDLIHADENKEQRIRSAATKGGLRDFAILLDHPKSFKAWLENEDMTVEDAVQEITGDDLTVELPFIKRLGVIASQLNSMSDEQIEKLEVEDILVKNLKKLQKACSNILEKIG